jgi:hypothetical protein
MAFTAKAQCAKCASLLPNAANRRVLHIAPQSLLEPAAPPIAEASGSVCSIDFPKPATEPAQGQAGFVRRFSALPRNDVMQL